MIFYVCLISILNLDLLIINAIFQMAGEVIVSFSRRRDSDINRAFMDGISELAGIRNDYHRLRILENAVINYGGGRNKLELRVRETVLRLRNIDAEAAGVLYDVAAYLRDIAIAGGLNNDSYGFNPHVGKSLT